MVKQHVTENPILRLTVCPWPHNHTIPHAVTLCHQSKKKERNIEAGQLQDRTRAKCWCPYLRIEEESMRPGCSSPCQHRLPTRLGKGLDTSCGFIDCSPVLHSLEAEVKLPGCCRSVPAAPVPFVDDGPSTLLRCHSHARGAWLGAAVSVYGG